MRFLHERLLIDFGCIVDTASNAEEALSLQGKYYDFILLDIGLLGMSGIELAEVLQRTLHPKTRLIGLTAYTDNQTLERCLETGIELVLHKPVDLDYLRSLINTKTLSIAEEVPP